MIRLSDAINDVISGNPLLQFGLQNRLFNLSNLAGFLQPHIEVRTKKDLNTNTIVMALSRMQRQMKNGTSNLGDFKIENLTIHTGLCTLTYTKTEEADRAIRNLYTAVQKKNEYITISEGINQITVIVDASHAEKLESFIAHKPLFKHMNIASLNIQFNAKHTYETPGFIYMMLQQLMLQNINLVEISSTFTELILYLDESDTRVAFDTLYHLFHAPERENG
ncbi:MAG: hypothetical protein WCX61_01385 [Candidatus Peribacteraceae bacterium]|jgi:aspartokinase